MTDWDGCLSGPRTVCAVTGREIPPGEEFYSAISYEAGAFHRYDLSAEAWEDQDAARYLSWWRQRRPPPKDAEGPRLVDAAVLLDLFGELKDSTERAQQCFLWFLTLILVRGRKLRYVDLVREDDGAWLVVREMGGKDKAHYRIRDPRMSPEETERVKDDLTRLFDGGMEVTDEGAAAD